MEADKRRWARLAVGAGLLALAVGNNGARSLVTSWLELRSLRKEIVALEEEERRLEQRLKAMKGGDAALERLARQELGFVKKGEIEYRFTPPTEDGGSR